MPGKAASKTTVRASDLLKQTRYICLPADLLELDEYRKLKTGKEIQLSAGKVVAHKQYFEVNKNGD